MTKLWCHFSGIVYGKTSRLSVSEFDLFYESLPAAVVNFTRFG